MAKWNVQFIITELFMAKAGRKGWDRCFHGTIRRETDADGNPVVYGKIKVKDGFVYTQAKDQWKLGERLDEMVLMVLDYALHASVGKSSNIVGTPYFYN